MQSFCHLETLVLASCLHIHEDSYLNYLIISKLVVKRYLECCTLLKKEYSSII